MAPLIFSSQSTWDCSMFDREKLFAWRSGFGLMLNRCKTLSEARCSSALCFAYPSNLSDSELRAKLLQLFYGDRGALPEEAGFNLVAIDAGLGADRDLARCGDSS